MIAEYLHTRLGVRIIRRLELQLSDSKLLKEFVQSTDEIAQGETVIGDYALDLMKFSEMRRV